MSDPQLLLAIVTVSPTSLSAAATVYTGWYTVQVVRASDEIPYVAPAGGWSFDLTESAGTADGTFNPGTTVTLPEGSTAGRFRYKAPESGTRTLLVSAEGSPFNGNTATAQAIVTGAVMATSSGTLGSFTPKDAALFGQPASVTKYNGVDAIKMPKPDGAASASPAVFFDGVLPGPAANGYSNTTGVQATIAWSAPKGDVAGAARFATAFDLKGATDLPLACADGTPAFGTANEIAANSTVNTTAGGINYVTISVPKANMKNGQTTNPAIGDYYRMRIRRCTENAGDTIANEVFVHSVTLTDY